MFSKITSKASGIAVTGLFMLTMGLGLVGSGGAVHAQNNNGGGTGEGEAGTCTYAGKTYSEGSKVKQDDGFIHRCNADGTWTLAFTTPTGGVKFNQTQTGGVLQRAP